MFEGDSDEDLLRKAGVNRMMDPNKYYKMKQELKAKMNKAKLQKEKQQARKEIAENSKKLKEEMSKKGVVTADQKMKNEQVIKDLDRQQAMQKEQGTTEQGSQTV